MTAEIKTVNVGLFKVTENGFESMNLADILSKIRTDEFIIVNDHSGKEEKLAGVGVYCNSAGQVDCLVGMFNSRYYSTNRLYLADDDKIHLSKAAAGPVVFMERGKHLVQKANDQQIFGSGIAAVFYSDNTVEEYELGRGAW